MKFQAAVRQIIFERYPATLGLAVLALLVCAAIAIPAGILAAHRRGRAPDRAISSFTLLGLAFPNFALGPVLILLFSIELGVLPVSGRSEPARMTHCTGTARRPTALSERCPFRMVVDTRQSAGMDKIRWYER